MKTRFLFTCQIEPGSAQFRCSNIQSSQSGFCAPIIRIICVAFLFIMSIAFLSTINSVYSASRKNEMFLKPAQYNRVEVLPDIGEKKTLSISDHHRENYLLKNGFPVEKFPVYIPFYFFFLGFFLVLTQRWILVKGSDALERKQISGINVVREKTIIAKNQRKIQLEGKNIGRKTLISVPMSN